MTTAPPVQQTSPRTGATTAPFTTTRPARTTRSTRHATAAHHPAFDKRDRILRAAADLVADGGFTAASPRNIAGLTGLATGAVHAEVGSTGQLQAELYRHLAARELAAVQEATADPTAAADRLTAAVDVFTRRALAGRHTSQALLFEPVSARVDHERLTFRRRYHALVSTIVSDGLHTGELPAQYAGITARAVIGAVTESLLAQHSPAAPEVTDDELVDQVARFCLRAVGA
ncbi:TetR/AcrR family transcriptional regulator [Corynebacterium nuruki]|uniref:TetR/AcrR family transcriptional regulator n=1 Tax=Corynebacterium nuruki TaxID=1032851 RepID=UPI00235584B9